MESGKVTIDFESVDCKQVIQEVLASQKLAAEVKHLTLSIEMPETDVVVQTDRRALTQIVLNLTNNAIKFTETGSVTMRLREMQQGYRVAIDVTDTGVGIAQEDQVQLFEAFKRVGPRGATVSEGTGLGLHLSRKLAELLHGEISFESTVGQGSRFSVLLRA